MNEELFLIISCILVLFFIKDFLTVFIVIAVIIFIAKYLKVDDWALGNINEYVIISGKQQS